MQQNSMTGHPVSKKPPSGKQCSNLPPATRQNSHECDTLRQIKFQSEADRVGSINYHESTIKNRNKSNYIDSRLVQKVLTCQKNRQRSETPIIYLNESEKNTLDVGSSSSADQNTLMHAKHRYVDAGISDKLINFHITDPDTCSTGSQRESGYHSGDSVGDHASASDMVEFGRTAHCVERPVMPTLSSPDDRCEYYFVEGDKLLDLYYEEEQAGNLEGALNIINHAIEVFQQALDVQNASSENLLRMRMKYNTAILRRRRLLKLAGRATESTARKLPCPPHEDEARSSANMFPRQHQPDANISNKLFGCSNSRDSNWCNQASNSGSRESIYREQNGFISGAFCLPNSGLLFKSENSKEIKLYATLPKNPVTCCSKSAQDSHKNKLPTRVMSESREQFYENFESKQTLGGSLYNDSKDYKNHQLSDRQRSGIESSTRETLSRMVPARARPDSANALKQPQRSDGQWMNDQRSYDTKTMI